HESSESARRPGRVPVRRGAQSNVSREQGQHNRRKPPSRRCPRCYYTGMLRLFGSAVLLLLISPGSVLAWGTSAHRYIMARSIDILPQELKPFFDHFRDELTVRVIDPDLWRNVGWDEESNHFLDFGVPEYGPYPFAELPREYGAAIEKFGMAALKRNGLLPWRAAEE